MLVTQKAQYAMRAIFELAKREGSGPVKISDIAEAQAIPQRFLENILNHLRQGGLVRSRRGKEGGYQLAHPAHAITAGQVLRLIEGEIYAVECASDPSDRRCPMYGDCVFLPLWEKARKALDGVYDETTFAQLVQQEQELAECIALTYCI